MHALQAFGVDALYKFTFYLLTYLLTYVIFSNYGWVKVKVKGKVQYLP